MILLLFFLLYTWNQRSGSLDSVAATVGLETVGSVMRLGHGVSDSATDFLESYFFLVDVRKENEILRNELEIMHFERTILEEKAKEVDRLRTLLNLDYAIEWDRQAAHILGWRMGANAILENYMISKGYMSGARHNFPVISNNGLVGKVYKAAPYTSIVIAITDPSSNVAVISSESRVHGILQGGGADNPLSVQFVKENTSIATGELLITSGLDQVFPKGIPVARIESVKVGTRVMLEIVASPLVEFTNLEEVLVLQPPADILSKSYSPVYYPRQETDFLEQTAGQGSSADGKSVNSTANVENPLAN